MKWFKKFMHPTNQGAGGSGGSDEQWDDDGQNQGGNQEPGNKTGNSGGQQQKQATGGGGQEETASKTFTQDDMIRIATREKRQGRESLLSELGVTEVELAGILEKHRLEQAKEKTPEQLENERLQREASEKEEKLMAATLKADRAEAESIAMRLKVNPEFVDDVIALATFAKMQSDKQDDFDFKEFISSDVKKKHPGWFEEAEDNSNNSAGQRGTGGAPPKPKSNKDENKGVGARLAASRKAANSANSKKSLWGS